MTPPNRASAETRAVQALHEIEAATGAVVPGIQPSSTFARDADYALRDGFVYSRDTCPTVRHAERIIASLEDGAAALLFASGLAACAALLETVPAGKRIAAPRIMYHGVQDWLVRLRDRRGIGLDFFDAADAASLAASVHPGETALLWLETPVNPSWDVIDIEAAAAIGHAAGALVAVDGTCASPVTTQALNLGADIVFHSATKYLNGHSDLTAGVLVERPDELARAHLAALRLAACSAPSRPGCSFAACARSSSASSAPRPVRSPSPGISRAIPPSSACSTRASRATPSTASRSAR